MRRILFYGGLSLPLLFASTAANAAIEPAGLLDEVADRFLAVSSSWAGTITDAASWLFWTLVVISMVWTFGMMALRKADLGEFFAEFARFTITTGFFCWLLRNGPKFAMDIINSMRTLAAQASGQARADAFQDRRYRLGYRRQGGRQLQRSKPHRQPVDLPHHGRDPGLHGGGWGKCAHHPGERLDTRLRRHFRPGLRRCPLDLGYRHQLLPIGARHWLEVANDYALGRHRRIHHGQLLREPLTRRAGA